MAYTRDWGPVESTPIDHSKFKNVPGSIREKTVDVAERLKDMIYGFTTGETEQYQFKKIPFLVQGTAPTTAANQIILYAEDTGSFAELKVADEQGNRFFLTKGGAIPVLGGEGWRSGDMLLSSNTGTPTGWSDVSGTYNNKFVRISSGTPLTTGGADTHNHGGATGSHALTTTEIPAHTHEVPMTDGSPGAATLATVTGSKLNNINTTSASVGGSAGHTHTISTNNNVPVYVQMKMYKKD